MSQKGLQAQPRQTQENIFENFVLKIYPYIFYYCPSSMNGLKQIESAIDKLKRKDGKNRLKKYIAKTTIR